jgi:hypothetical protein
VTLEHRAEALREELHITGVQYGDLRVRAGELSTRLDEMAKQRAEEDAALEAARFPTWLGTAPALCFRFATARRQQPTAR